MFVLHYREEAAFSEVFAKACPKFINPCPPEIYDDGNVQEDVHLEVRKVQTKVFLEEVEQQLLLGTIRSYLKLYTTISIPKLALFLEMSPAQVREQLLCYKHKTSHVPHLGPRLPESSTASDMSFNIDGDMVHVTDVKVDRQYTDFFVRHINKFDSINSRLLARTAAH